MAKQRINPVQVNTTMTTAEQDTGKVWVDGRPIYRKVLRGQFTVAVGANNVTHGISGITSSFELVFLQGGIKLGAASVSGTSNIQTFHYRETAGNWISPTAVEATYVVFTSSFAWGNSYYTVVMEYVK